MYNARLFLMYFNKSLAGVHAEGMKIGSKAEESLGQVCFVTSTEFHGVIVLDILF